MLDPKPDAEREKANPEPGVCLRVSGSDFESKKRELLLLESIDQGLVDLLGRRARDAVYDHLARKCYMAREEIPQRLGEFCSVLRFNFGKAGATIERTIAKRFYSRLEKKFIDYPGYGLVDYVEKATSKPSKPAVDVPITTTTVTTFTFTGQPNNA